MKFDCGETQEENIVRLEQWHPFFAILPRKVADHDCRWLETIERREIITSRYDESKLVKIYYWDWEYRAKQGGIV